MKDICKSLTTKEQKHEENKYKERCLKKLLNELFKIMKPNKPHEK